jgi:hypothetical protein
MMRIFGWAMFALVVIVMTINASFMMISPRAWFRLPGWLRAQGSLAEERYSAGGGALQLRVAGVLILASLAWVGYELLK